MSKETTLIIIAHTGLDRKITEEECKNSLQDVKDEKIIFINFDIGNSKLKDLYYLPFEQLALEQFRKYKREIEPILQANPQAKIAYFGLVPIPLAFHLGVLMNEFSEYIIFQFHHEKKVWYQEISPVEDLSFELIKTKLPQNQEKGKGDVFIRIGTSYRIEDQHTFEVLSNPTNEFDITLKQPHVDALSNQNQIQEIANEFQKVLSAYTNFLPDRDKIHLFIASSSGLPFILGTKINPNIYPFVQTYQYSKDESPKYKEAILITKRSENARTYSIEEKELAAEIREKWNIELREKVIPFIKNSLDGLSTWFEHIIQNKKDLNNCMFGNWGKLPNISETSLIEDSIDLENTNVNNGFSYNNVESRWIIDDAMFISLNTRLSKIGNSDILKAGRLFLFHEGLHYSQAGHNLIAEIADGIGKFPKVIEEADYQADAWAILYEYRYSSVHYNANIESNLKKFFLDTIDIAVETMWSFVDLGEELTEIQIRSMNRFLNWYWQWVRIEQLRGNGSLSEIIEILFNKPVIEYAGADVFTLNAQRVYFKLNIKQNRHCELALFFNNRVFRFAPTGINNISAGFREMDGSKIKEALRSFFYSINR
jgi:hypothetical protein